MAKPYKIGDRVSILGCSPFVVTEVIPVVNPVKEARSWEYKAAWQGGSFRRYWGGCETYWHSMVDGLEVV
jgi:hypothetical protein